MASHITPRWHSRDSSGQPGSLRRTHSPACTRVAAHSGLAILISCFSATLDTVSQRSAVMAKLAFALAVLACLAVASAQPFAFNGTFNPRCQLKSACPQAARSPDAPVLAKGFRCRPVNLNSDRVVMPCRRKGEVAQRAQVNYTGYALTVLICFNLLDGLMFPLSSFTSRTCPARLKPLLATITPELR